MRGDCTGCPGAGLILYTEYGQGSAGQCSQPAVFPEGVRDAQTSADYRKTVRSWLLDYYTRNQDDPSLDDFLKELDLYDYADAGLVKLQELLTGGGLYEEAYRLVLKYGHDHTPLSLLVRICSQMVLESEYQEDEKLLGYCSSCFFSGKYDKNILSYLLMYPDGSVPEKKKRGRPGKSTGLIR